MTAVFQKSDCTFFSGQVSETKRFNLFLILLFASAVVFAQAGITKLPESYRTPLSDMVYDDLNEWRTVPEDDNPWRGDEEELLIKPRLKVKLFPKYNYDSLENPISNSLFQNENEIERPVSNILEYTF